MRILQQWLEKHFKRELNISELKDILEKKGLELSGEYPAEDKFEKVIIGQILKIEQHPDADKLVYCEVIIGTETYHIVCGAKNMKEGDKIPVAMVGARLPNGIKIKRSKIRGIQSEGMLCSPIELGMGEDSSGLMILPEDAPVGDKLLDYLDISGNILEVTLKKDSEEAEAEEETDVHLNDLVNVISEGLNIS